MNLTMLSATDRQQVWRWTGWTVAAHVAMLEQIGTIDGEAAAAVRERILAVASGAAPDLPLLALVTAFDERVDAQVASGYAGVTRVARGTIDVAATAARCVVREALLDLARATEGVREALLEFASPHTVTLMPAAIDGIAAQPTTWAHFLGGVIGPLSRASSRVSLAYTHVNQSPLGAGALASSGLENDRRATAALLGFDDPVANTFDAVNATDHFAAAADATALALAPVRRLFEELLAMARSEPGSVLLTAEAMTPLPDVPQAQTPTQLEALIRSAEAAESQARATSAQAGSFGYGPVASGLEAALATTLAALSAATAVLGEGRALIASGLDINRALLANRAGRAFITASDLADVLMLEEQVDPASARAIAALTISRARDEGIEAAGIKPELIDGAALLVLGQELKVEFEVISRYLAPRRFIERRTAVGAPSPASTRAFLDDERVRLKADAAWTASLSKRNHAAIEKLRAG